MKTLLITTMALFSISAGATSPNPVQANPCQGLAIQNGFVDAATDAVIMDINTTSPSILNATNTSQTFRPDVEVYLESIEAKHPESNKWTYEVKVKSKTQGGRFERSIHYLYPYLFRIDEQGRTLCTQLMTVDLEGPPDEE